MKYTIFRLGNSGWYNFESIPQGYIKICNLQCLTDKKALKQAKKMSDADFEIIEKEIEN